MLLKKLSIQRQAFILQVLEVMHLRSCSKLRIKTVEAVLGSGRSPAGMTLEV